MNNTLERIIYKSPYEIYFRDIFYFFSLFPVPADSWNRGSGIVGTYVIILLSYIIIIIIIVAGARARGPIDYHPAAVVNNAALGGK